MEHPSLAFDSVHQCPGEHPVFRPCHCLPRQSTPHRSTARRIEFGPKGLPRRSSAANCLFAGHTPRHSPPLGRPRARPRAPSTRPAAHEGPEVHPARWSATGPNEGRRLRHRHRAPWASKRSHRWDVSPHRARAAPYQSTRFCSHRAESARSPWGTIAPPLGCSADQRFSTRYPHLL
jgi:hypothetical protein